MGVVLAGAYLISKKRSRKYEEKRAYTGTAYRHIDNGLWTPYYLVNDEYDRAEQDEVKYPYPVSWLAFAR